ncbi:MAG: vitamin K epoxide reductase family protein [Candidatus Cyclobacteriaceae bacterium M2_1C_046]
MKEFAEKGTAQSHELHIQHHKKHIWVQYLNMSLGLWLISDPFTFGYDKSIITYNTIACGAGLIFFSFLALHPYRIWAKWAINFIGFWLLVYPILFWVDTGEAYSLTTLAGTLVIGLNLLVTNMPGAHLIRTTGPTVPPGWTYNPSKWEERIPVLTIAWFGFFIARYLATFQLKFIEHIPDPLFGEGTMKVIDSDLSKSFPISDAALGAFSYLLDVLMGYLGSVARWRTMPWVVLIFAILIIPLGVVSISLVISQPLIVGFWCFYCLLTAIISVSMMPFTFDEAFASIGFLIKAKKEGQSFWKVFWKGGTLKEWNEEEQPQYDSTKVIQSTAKDLVKDAKSIPFNLAVTAAIGAWIMIMPGFFDYSDTTLASSDIITGAITITFSIACMSEVARIGRLANVLFGLWLAASVFIFQVDASNYQWVHLVTAAALIGFAIPRGPIVEKHGMWDKYIK